MPLPIFDEPWRKGGVGLLPYQVDIPAPQAAPAMPALTPSPPSSPPVQPPTGGLPGSVGPGEVGDTQTYPDMGGSFNGEEYTPPDLFESFPGLKGLLAKFAPFKSSPVQTSSAATTGGTYGGGLNAGYRPGDIQREQLRPMPDTPGEQGETWDPDTEREQFGDRTGRDYFGELFQREQEQQQEQQRQYLADLFAQEAMAIPEQRRAETEALINGAIGLTQQDLAMAEGTGGMPEEPYQPQWNYNMETGEWEEM